MASLGSLFGRIVENMLSEIIAGLVVGVLAAIATYFFRPRLEYWRERRRLRREAREEKRHAQEKAVKERRIENERLQGYLDCVANLCSTTRVFGQAQPISLDDIYTAVQVLKSPQALRRFSIDQLRDDREMLQPHDRVSALALVQASRRRRFLILGKPGAGKTTYLRYLARQAALGKLNKIPIFVTLRDWAATDKDLLSYIIDQFELCHFDNARAYVNHLLEDTDKALVLLDGLDEIRQVGDLRAKAIGEIRNFSLRYSQAHILVTCRVAATDYTFERFTYVEIADFDDDQIKAFVEKWFQDNPTKRDAFLTELALPEHRGLHELACVPLLLTMLCLAFDVNTAFPKRRVEIYEDALDALLRKWDSVRNIRRDEIYQGLSVRRKHQMFAHIAAEASVEGEYLLPQREVEIQIVDYLENLPGADKPSGVQIDGAAVLKAIEAQHCILIERAHRIYSFAHLTFQEYYTARYIVENAAQDTLQRLVAYAPNDRWREIILLTASLLGEADVLFDHFFPFLDSLVQGRGRRERVGEFLAWAARKAASLEADRRTPAIRSCYVCLAMNTQRHYELAYTIARSFDLDPVLGFLIRLDRALQTAQKTTQNIDADKSHEFSHTLRHTLDRIPNPDLALDISLHLISRIAFIPSLVQVLDWSLEDARSRAKRLDMDLHSALGTLRVSSTPEGLLTNRRIFVEDLRKIMIQHRDIGYPWAFHLDPADVLSQYLTTTNLLVECLNLAYVTDRTAIERRLLLPPGWKGDA
jgi:adenylate kinase family enzyme